VRVGCGICAFVLSADTALDIIDVLLSQLCAGAQRGGDLHVPMMMPMMPIRKEEANQKGVSACVET
jgi:hypothetical protein